MIVPMKDPAGYLEEIRRNLETLRGTGGVSETERALFGMIDGLAGMLHHSNERTAALERQVADLTRLHSGSSSHATTTRTP